MSYIDRWDSFEWWEKVAVIPGIIFVSVIAIILFPIFLIIWIIGLTFRFFGEEESDDLFY
jgi:hypothetical protein